MSRFEPVGWRSRTTLALNVGLGLAVVGWPVWASASAPGTDAQRAELPWVLSAQVMLLALLAVACWRDAGRRWAALAPVCWGAAATALVRVFGSPAANGIEPAYALALLTGAVVGGPGGFLAGCTGGLVSSVALGLVDTPLPGQVLVFGLWGAVGGWFARAPRVAAWLGLLVAAVPLAVVSGVVLNATGWVAADGEGAFLPGLGPWDSLVRLWEHTAATSLALDLVRGFTCALVVAVAGLPLLGALRARWGLAPAAVQTTADPPSLNPDAVDRRRRSLPLRTLWTGDLE